MDCDVLREIDPKLYCALGKGFSFFLKGCSLSLLAKFVNLSVDLAKTRLALRCVEKKTDIIYNEKSKKVTIKQLIKVAISTIKIVTSPDMIWLFKIDLTKSSLKKFNNLLIFSKFGCDVCEIFVNRQKYFKNGEMCKSFFYFGCALCYQFLVDFVFAPLKNVDSWCALAGVSGVLVGCSVYLDIKGMLPIIKAGIFFERFFIGMEITNIYMIVLGGVACARAIYSIIKQMHQITNEKIE